MDIKDINWYKTMAKDIRSELEAIRPIKMECNINITFGDKVLFSGKMMDLQSENIYILHNSKQIKIMKI